MEVFNTPLSLDVFKKDFTIQCKRSHHTHPEATMTDHLPARNMEGGQSCDTFDKPCVAAYNAKDRPVFHMTGSHRNKSFPSSKTPL
jgi:hypothetical protein